MHKNVADDLVVTCEKVVDTSETALINFFHCCSIINCMLTVVIGHHW